MGENSAKEELQVAMDAVRGGEKYMNPSVSKTVTGRDHELAPNSESQLLQLTPRQRQVLQLLAEGKNTKEIGSMLQISPKTVETHRMQFMVRLKIHDVPGLVRFAIRSGLVSSQA
jgi:DNA-binding NarL/FixJ family response regulator